MGLFDFFKSNEDKIRSKIRKGFDDSVKHAVRNSEFKDDLFLGLLVQAAIGNFYQSMKGSSELWLLANHLGVDYDSILEDECKSALHNYLK